MLCSGHSCVQDYIHKIFRKAGVRARQVLFPMQRSPPQFQCLSYNPRLQIPVSIPGQAADGDSVYSESWAGVVNALFCPLPSSCCLCWPDVPVCEAEVLCGLPRGENSEVRTCRASLKNPAFDSSTAGCCTSTGRATDFWCCLQELLALGSAGKPLSFG